MAGRLVLGSGFVAQAFGGGISRSASDYTDESVFGSLINTQVPDAVINCAGFTGRPNIDECEDKRAETIRANILLPAMLSRVCGIYRIPFVHISSGCIYSGDNDGRGWSETDKPSPLSFYSLTKALSEEVINGYILRIRMPFVDGTNKRDFLHKLLSYPKLISHPNSLTYLPDLVEATEALLKGRAPYGIYNVVNSGAVTHRQIVETFNRHGIQWCPQFIEDYEFNKMVKAPRSNCVLSNEKLKPYYDMPSGLARMEEAAHAYPYLGWAA